MKLSPKFLLITGTVSLLLSACSQREEGVYGEPIPDPDDRAAINAILTQLEGEDQRLWGNIKTRLNAADLLGVESDSVREALEVERRRVACAEENDPNDVAMSDTEEKRARLERAGECSRWPI